jgi:hypothetical protein
VALAAVSATMLTMLAFSGVAEGRTGCVSALLDDWRDGRIDGIYSVECYQTALGQLPEDLRIYSSAESDIKRALLARGKVTVSAPAKARKPTASTAGGGVSPFLVLAIAGVIVAALGSAFALAR